MRDLVLPRYAVRVWALAVSAALLAQGHALAQPAEPPQAQPSQGAAQLGSPADQILGNWLTQNRDGIIQISLAPDGSLQGRIVGGARPDDVDSKDPDPAMRKQPLIGLVIMRGIRYAGEGHWTDGTIYDPDSGKTYRCRIQLLGPDRLRMRGFLGVSLLGRSQIWTRYRGTSMTLPPPAH